MPRPFDIVRGIQIRVDGKTARLADEQGLGEPVSRVDVSTPGTGLASVRRIDAYNHASQPGLLVFQIQTEVTPSLVEDALVETSLLSYVPAWYFCCAFGTGRHVLNLQILQYDASVVFAYLGTDLMKVVVAHVGNLDMKSGDLRFLLVPVL